MDLSQNNVSAKRVCTKILEYIQILLHNGDISIDTKNKLVSELKTATATKDFSKLHDMFKGLSYGALLSDVFQECLELTESAII